jgi:DNA-binding transcriptional LysR family regulator
MNVMPLHRFDGEPLVDKVDLKRLRFFLAVAEAQSFSRAAERLRIAQSHVSRQIMSLEEALGHRLFVRRARHVELTDAGQVLLAETGHVMQRLNALPERMSAASAGAIGSLCIGIAAAGSFHSIVARTIESFARQRPKFVLKFSVASRSQLLESIVDRRVQACFARAPAPAWPEIRVEPLITQPMVIALPKSHRLAARDQVDLSEIAGDPFVMVERNWAPELYDDVIVACRMAGFEPQLVCHSPHELGALQLVSTGMAVTLVPAFVGGMNFENVHFASIADSALSASLEFITRNDEHSIGVRLLRKQALAIAGRSQTAYAHSGAQRTDNG